MLRLHTAFSSLWMAKGEMRIGLTGFDSNGHRPANRGLSV